MLRPSGLPEALQNLERTLVMGVLNVTPDSFSDGGKFADTQHAIAQGMRLNSTGADIIDVGGESTRPGASRVSIQEELDRVIPVVAGLAELGITVSVDTMRAGVAREATMAGAKIINDVSGGKSDPDMLATMAELAIPFILMHWRGPSDEMTTLATYQDVVEDVCAELETQVTRAIESGIKRENIVLDPGLGFAKTVEQNWPILQNLEALQSLGFPLLVGASRKKFLGELLADENGARGVDEREAATTALTTMLALRRVWAVRVHNTQDAFDAVTVVQRLQTL